jgi:hypothetical protein
MKIQENTVLFLRMPPWGPPKKNTPNPRPMHLTHGLHNPLAEREK